jgi:hypothetical protein
LSSAPSPAQICENSSVTTPVEARLVAFPYVICHTGRSPGGTICSGYPPVHMGKTASKLRISVWMNRTRGSLHYRRYTGRSPVSISFWAPPVRTGGAAGGSISSVQPSLGLNPHIIAVTPVAKLYCVLSFCLCWRILLAGRETAFGKPDPDIPAVFGPHR